MRAFVLDVETTGLDPVRHRVIEIALVELGPSGDAVDHWSTLVRPSSGGEVEQEALRVNGIRLEHLRFAPAEADVAEEVARRLLPDATIVAHNAPFDLGFLHHMLGRNGYPEWQGDFVCTRTAFGILVPGQKRSLHHVANYFGIPIDRRHRALGDALVTAAVFKRLAAMAAEQGIDLRNLLLFDPERIPVWIPPKARWWKAA